MEKFLMFIDDGDDAATYPASRLLGMTCAGDGALLLKFEGSVMDTTVEEDNIDLITLTITADTEKAVMSEIARAINGQRNTDDGLLVVCDDVNSVFLHPNILSCTITLDA
tara:strand:- start:51 stop:380 length:330 start_codon:yes stop_codon:yes gene_type:complete